MSSIVYLKNKTNGRTYAYLNESIWDSENKKCRCKRKCLGHIDPNTGEIVPNKRNAVTESATVRSMGATFFLRKISDSIGLTDVIREALPDDWELFMTCMFYILIEDDQLSGLKYWSVDNEIPFKGEVDNDTVSRLLGSVDMNTLFRFFRAWRDTFGKEDFSTMYISSLTSYDRKTEMIRFNDLPLVYVEQRTNMSITFDNNTMMPVSYEVIGHVPHSITEIRRIGTDESWLDYDKVTKILDSSYYTEENFMDLLRFNERFIMHVPMESQIAKDSVERVRDRVMDIQYSIEIGGEPFFAMSFLHYFEGKKCYMHIFFSTSDAEKEFSLFLDLINDCKNELINDEYIPEHDEFYKKYFIIRNHSYGKEVEENGEAIMTYNTVAGFVVLVSNTVKNAKEALEMFMMRSRIQKNFENLKNERDRSRLDLNDDDKYNGRLLLQFASTILYREIRRRARKHSIIMDIPFSDIMREMSIFKKISIPGFDTPFFTNINNTQSKILKAFDMDVKELR